MANMTDADNSLPSGTMPNGAVACISGNGQVRGWLLLAVSALGVSALMALLLVAARAPGLASFLAGRIAFADALVLHVNFSILVWCLSLAGMLWAWLTPRAGVWPLSLAGCGALLMLLTPLSSGPATAVLSNYVPVLDQPLYLAGLAGLSLGVLLAALRFLLASNWLRVEDCRTAPRLGLACVAITVLVAGVLLVLSWFEVPTSLPRQLYFERLFWGSGHVLQIAFAQLMAVAWFWLAGLGGWPLSLSRSALTIGWMVGLLPALGALGVAVTGADPRAYTALMALSGIWLLWPIAVILAGWCGARRHASSVVRLALGASMGLCLLGSVLGGLIRDDSLLVPAHYHAITGAVTLSLMGLVHALVPQLGGHSPRGRWMHWQMGTYAAGVTLMALGLAWSGGQGGMRKTPGEPVGEAMLAGMAMMGVGGVAAVMAVMTFVGLLGLAMVRGSGFPAIAFLTRRVARRESADGS